MIMSVGGFLTFFQLLNFMQKKLSEFVTSLMDETQNKIVKRVDIHQARNDLALRKSIVHLLEPELDKIDHLLQCDDIKEMKIVLADMKDWKAELVKIEMERASEEEKRIDELCTTKP